MSPSARDPSKHCAAMNDNHILTVLTTVLDAMREQIGRGVTPTKDSIAVAATDQEHLQQLAEKVGAVKFTCILLAAITVLRTAPHSDIGQDGLRKLIPATSALARELEDVSKNEGAELVNLALKKPGGRA